MRHLVSGYGPRAAGAGHPYVVGKAAVSAFLTVAGECAQAGLAGQ